MESYNNDIKSQLEQITSISLLEDLQSQDSKIKINAIHNLKGISLALGYEATRKELFPYLKNCINNEEEDEVLIELTKILSNFYENIGGIQYFNELLNLFEVILNIDEPTIRKEAINSMENILKQIGNIKDIENDLINFIKKFYNGEEINQKITSINLIILVYKYLEDKNNNKKILIKYLDNFIESDNIAIKKEFIKEIIKIVNYLNIDYIKKIIISLIKNENENIKIDIINLIINLKSHKDNIIILDYIYNIIQILSEDINNNVRLYLINNICELMKFPKINNYNYKQIILNIYIKLIQDKDEKIRNACCNNLEEITKILKNEINFNKLLQNIQLLSKDEKIYIRNNLLDNIYKISPLLNKKQLNDIIFPIFNELIKDENLDIKINLINNIINLMKNNIIEINDNLIEKIIPSLIEISQNKSWRIKIKIINIIPNFINQTNLFLKNIFPICLNYLTDHVYTIRDEGCKLLCELYKDITNKEYENKLIEKLNSMMNCTNYLFRNTCLIFIKYFIDKINNKIYFDFFQNKLIFFVYKLSNDKISNVRLNCAIIFKKVENCNFKDKTNNDKIKKCIDILKKDQDIDVINIFK